MTETNVATSPKKADVFFENPESKVIPMQESQTKPLETMQDMIAKVEMQKAAKTEKEQPKTVVEETSSDEQKSQEKQEEKAEEQKTEPIERPKRKRISFSQNQTEEKVQEAVVELPLDVKKRLARLEEIENMNAVKAVLKASEEGKDIFSELSTLAQKNPSNLTLDQLYEIDLKTKGITDENDIKESQEWWDGLTKIEKINAVSATKKALEDEYNSGLASYKVFDESKVNIAEDAAKKFTESINSTIDSFLGKEVWGEKMDAKSIARLKEQVQVPLWTQNEKGEVDYSRYLEMVWVHDNLQSILDAEFKAGEAFGVSLKKDEETHSGEFAGGGVTSRPVKKEKTGIDYHRENAPAQFFTKPM